MYPIEGIIAEVETDLSLPDKGMSNILKTEDQTRMIRVLSYCKLFYANEEEVDRVIVFNVISVSVFF